MSKQLGYDSVTAISNASTLFQIRSLAIGGLNLSVRYCVCLLDITFSRILCNIDEPSWRVICLKD